MSYLYESHLKKVASAMRATGDPRGELLTAIIRRGINEQWPTPWLIAALERHTSIEQAEELAHQELVYYRQSLLIAEQISVAERLGLRAFKTWITQPTACAECRKMDGIQVPIDTDFPTLLIKNQRDMDKHVLHIRTQFLRVSVGFQLQKGNAVAWR